MVGVLLGTSSVLQAAQWDFGEVRTLHEAAPGTVLTLNGYGRSGLAVRAGRLAVVWESEADGRPQVNLVTGTVGDEDEPPAFEAAQPVQLGHRGRMPAVVPLGERDRFALLWEEDERLLGRLWRDGHLDPPVPLDNRRVRDPVAVAGGREARILWQRPGRNEWGWGRLRLEREQLGREWRGPVAPEGARGERRQPAMAAAGDATLLVWIREERQYTRVQVARSPDGESGFGRPSSLNPLLARAEGAFGRHPLVSHPVIASDSNRLVAAAWLEERGDGRGPRPRVVVSKDAGRRFPDVEEVLGEAPQPAYRTAPSLAVSPLGLVAMVWESRPVDDESGETTGPPHLKVASRDGEKGWQDAILVPADDGGAGAQQPLLHLDGEGYAHLVWLEGEPGDGMRVRYLRARIQPD